MRFSWFIILVLYLALSEGKPKGKNKRQNGRTQSSAAANDRGGARQNNRRQDSSSSGSQTPIMGPEMFMPQGAQMPNGTPSAFQLNAMKKMKAILGRILGTTLGRFDEEIQEFQGEFWRTLMSGSEVMQWIQGRDGEENTSRNCRPGPPNGMQDGGDSQHSGPRPPTNPGNMGDNMPPEGCDPAQFMPPEEPGYTTVCTSLSGYELRRYEPLTWVTTTIPTTSFDAAAIVGFRKLLMYIKGYNNRNQTIKMTLPVRNSMHNPRRPIARPSLIRQGEAFKVAFYLPRDLHEDPPTPNDPEVTIERDNLYVYTLNFTGFAHGVRIYDKFFELRRMLDAADQTYDRQRFTVNVFNPPWMTVGRRNEILIPANTENIDSEDLCAGAEPSTSKNIIRQCIKMECPAFTTDDQITTSIILRKVEGGVFAIKRSDSCSMSLDRNGPYKALSRYFKGANDRKQRMDRTTPFGYVVRRTEGDNARCRYDYDLSFYIPREYHDDPPVPTDPTVAIITVEPSYHYVLTYETEGTSLTEKYQELKQVLKTNGYCFVEDIYFSAYFEAPWRSGSHHAEVSVPVIPACDEELYSELY